MPSKRLSVIIPGYNNPESWWKRCLDSVLHNIGADDEVICIDDGSERKPSVIEEYVQKDIRIKSIYRDSRGGPAVARNAGLELVQGEYVTFIDSDDELLPEVYAKSLKYLTDDADIVCFGVDTIWINESLHRISLPNLDDSGALDVNAVKRFLENTLMYYVWNKVYSAKFLEKNGLRFNPEMEMGEDLDFILRCVMLGARWKMLDFVGIRYYRTHASILSRYKPTYVKGIRQTTQMWKDYKSSVRDGRHVLGSFGETSEVDLWRGEWDNIWRLKTPYTLLERLEFARQHPEISMGNAYLFFFKKLIFSVLRRWLYIRPVQRWHIKKVYPEVKVCERDGTQEV